LVLNQDLLEGGIGDMDMAEDTHAVNAYVLIITRMEDVGTREALRKLEARNLGDG
jgi:hypothetical protein